MKKTWLLTRISLLILALAGGNSLSAQDATPAATPADAAAKPAEASATTEADKTPAGTETAANIDPAQQQLVIREAIRRKALLFQKSKDIQEIKILINTGKYDEASKALNGILASVPNVGDTAVLHTQVSDMTAEIAVHRAHVALDAHQYYEAKRQAGDALKLQPENKEALEILVEADKVITAGMPTVTGPDGKKVTPQNPALTESFLKRLERVQGLLKEAQDDIATGQYDDAAKTYRTILSISPSNPTDSNDPYNVAAMKGLEKVIDLQRQFAEKSTDVYNARRVVDVQAGWSQRLELTEAATPEGGTAGDQGAPITRSTDFDVNQRLKKLRLQVVDFKDAPITEIAQVLTTRSREADPDKRGILILVSQDATAKAKPVTVSLRNIPLTDALRYIARLANVKYRIDPEGVTMVPLEAPTDVFVVREFDVPASFVQPNEAGGADATASAGYDKRRRPTGVEEVKGTDGVKKALVQKGVTFAGEASAVYNAATGKLTVKNTQDQIDFIEQLVISFEADLNIAKVIKLETRVLEVQVQNNNDLSFDWGITGPGASYKNPTSGSAVNANALTGRAGTVGDATGNGVSSTGIGGTERALRNSSQLPFNGIDAVTSGVRAADVTSTTANNISYNTLNVRAFINRMQLQAMLTALNQRTDTNLMSAPAILINSGSGEGLIEVIQEFIYPKEYAAPMVTIPGGAGGTTASIGIPMVLPSWPTSFVDPARKVGISIRVIAATANDTNTKIALEMEPTITDFTGFIDYGSPIYASYYTATIFEGGLGGVGGGLATVDVQFNNGPVKMSDNPVRVPIFSVRAFDGGFKTDVLDGYTVVLAGLLSESLDTIDDKIPILGDLPFVGRAFRSKVERAVRKNLLIMVTPRILQPNGQPVNPDAGTPKEQEQPVAMN